MWYNSGMTTFEKNDRVRARVTAQGLTKGETYTVFDVRVMSLPFGDYVTYHVGRNDNGNLLSISNGHLLLEKV